MTSLMPKWTVQPASRASACGDPYSTPAGKATSILDRPSAVTMLMGGGARESAFVGLPSMISLKDFLLLLCTKKTPDSHSGEAPQVTSPALASSPTNRL